MQPLKHDFIFVYIVYCLFLFLIMRDEQNTKLG